MSLPHLGGPWATPLNSVLWNCNCGGSTLPQATCKGLTGNYVCLMQCQEHLFISNENAVPLPALPSLHFTHKQAQTHADGLPTAQSFPESLSCSLIFKRNTFVKGVLAFWSPSKGSLLVKMNCIVMPSFKMAELMAEFFPVLSNSE